jgi:dephospho-CoA kinase
MIVIGLTGGIGTGKSEVTSVLAGLGASVIDADVVGHEVYRKGTEGHSAVIDRFGPGVVGADGEIDRAALGKLVFGDPQALAGLNSVVHPRIRRAVRERLSALRGAGAEVVVLEAAVLIEAGWEDMVDEVWAVESPWEAVVSRLGPRFGGDERAIAVRAGAQMTQEDRRRAVDVTILNDGSLDRLRRRVERVYKTRIESARERTSDR